MARKQQANISNERLQRLIEKISWTKYSVKYLAGATNLVADLFYRTPSTEEGPKEVPRQAHLSARIHSSDADHKKDKSILAIAKMGRKDP